MKGSNCPSFSGFRGWLVGCRRIIIITNVFTMASSLGYHSQLQTVD